MGCFIACFGANSKHRISKKSTPTSRNLNLFRRPLKCEPAQCAAKPTQVPKIHDSIKPISESSENKEEGYDACTQKKISFDLNVGANDEVKVQEVANSKVENEEKATEKESCKAEEVEIEKDKEVEKEAKEENRKQSQAFSDSSNSSMISYPPMHRYHKCTSCEDKYLDINLCDTGYDNGSDVMIQQESSGSLFSLSIGSRKEFNRVEVEEKEVTSPLKTYGSSEKEMKLIDSKKETGEVEFDDMEVNNPLKAIGSPEREMKSIGLHPNPRDRSQYAGSVLNPVENPTQWKVAVKARRTTHLSYEEKENANLDQELSIIPKRGEPSFKRLGQSLKENAGNWKPVDNDIAVDTSLSSWLVESDKTPASKESPSSVGDYSVKRVNSWRSFEDRPILGSLTVEEAKQLSASSSSRRSPSRKCDEMKIIGSVGSYWRHTGQAMDSSNSGSSHKERQGRSRRFREDKIAANCHATPLGTRLERAMDRVTV